MLHKSIKHSFNANGLILYNESEEVVGALGLEPRTY
jgi:hypothetical protein